MPARSIRTVYVKSPRLASLPAVLMVWGNRSSAAPAPKTESAASPASGTPAQASARTRKPGT